MVQTGDRCAECDKIFEKGNYVSFCKTCADKEKKEIWLCGECSDRHSDKNHKITKSYRLNDDGSNDNGDDHNGGEVTPHKDMIGGNLTPSKVIKD